MEVHVVKAEDGETAERSDAAIFEGGQVWGRGLSAGLSEDTNVSVVQFSAGARAGWHTHTRDQVLYVVSGIGKVGDREGERVISAGDCAVVPAGIEHWHGSHDSGSPMAHLSITPVGSETSVLEG
jgi:quercetin dioxygenase-like cupin family protein